MESRHLVVMMTDIQGFTRATSGMGRDAVEGLLARHEDLLVPVIKEHEGTIVKGLGDAFLCTFESPTLAVEAGIRIQEVLREHNSQAPEPEQLRVRVALNAGEVNIREADVFGEAVNITARVEGVCAAEQVTLTEAVYLLIDRDRLATEYLEEVELKGIPFPVKLYRVEPHWLDPEERDLERARSKAAAPPPEEAAPRRRWGPLLALALLAGGVGAWVAMPPSPASRVEALVAQGELEEAFAVFEEAQRRTPSPELVAAGRAMLEAREAELRARGERHEVFRQRVRFSKAVPGLEGLTRPEDLVALGMAEAEALRERDPASADALLDELRVAGGLEAYRQTLTAWSRADLARAWEQVIPGGGPVPPDLARLVASEDMTRRLGRLKELAPKDPWVLYVEAVADVLAAADTPFERRRYSSLADEVQGLVQALRAEPDLGKRRELGEVAKVLLRYFPPENDDFWGWGEHLLTQRFGAWLDPLLEAWANRPPPEGAGIEERLSNRNLRRNALRLLARRGRGVAADPAVHLAADIALLRLRPKQIKDAEFLAELQDVALRYSALAPPGKASHEPALRRLLEAGLLDDHEVISWREAHLSVACQHGFEDLCVPARETYRDLLYYLRTRLGDWRFKGGEWFEEAVGELLGKVPELGEPWRERSRELLREVREDLLEKAPALAPQVEAALGS